jgi:hypothetical protein
MRKLALCTLALLALAACNDGRGGSIFGSETPSSGATTSSEGCASGQRADVLHQNRPGGSDYSTIRCHTQGY